MPILAKEGGGGQFLIPPPDVYQAVCFNVWDLGLQTNNFNGVEGKPLHKVLIGWEIEEKIPTGEYAGKRFCIYKKYTLSLNAKANLLKDLVSWRNKPFTDEEKAGFDLERLVGVNCQISVIHNAGKNGNVYANISSILPIKRGTLPMKPENGRTTPDWIKKIQGAAVEPDEPVIDENGGALENGNGNHAEEEIEIPF